MSRELPPYSLKTLARVTFKIIKLFLREPMTEPMTEHELNKLRKNRRRTISQLRTYCKYE